MDPQLRSQSTLHARSGGGLPAPSRATRILQKMTGRIKIYPSRKPEPLPIDDNNPYPSEPGSRSSMVGAKPYMSHPMLNSTLVEPYASGDEQYSPSQSSSPDETFSPGVVCTTPPTIHAVAPKVVDGLPISLSHSTPFVYNTNDQSKSHIRPPRPTRPPPNAPSITNNRTVTDPAQTHPSFGTVITSQNMTSAVAVPNQKQSKANEATGTSTSNFSPARLFARKASRPNLNNDAHSRKSADERQSEAPPPVPPKHNPTPSIVVSGAQDASSAPKRPKPARIDTNLSASRLFSKPSRPQLAQETHPKRKSDDPPTPHSNASNRAPTPPPPLPVLTKAAPPSSSTTSAARSLSSYPTTASTLDTTPSKSSGPSAPRLQTASSTSDIPKSIPPPPILQRSETAPHTYRLSIRLSRPSPFMLLNLPTLPSPTLKPPSPQRVRLRDMPELRLNDGRRREEDDDDDDGEDEDDEDDEGRSSGRPTLAETEEDGGHPRPSISSTVTASSLGRGKTHSRSSSYNHSLSLSETTSRETDLGASTSFESSSSWSHDNSFSSDLLSLPVPDTSRLSLDFNFSFLDRASPVITPPTPPPKSPWKGKGRAMDVDESGTKTPTTGSVNGGYFTPSNRSTSSSSPPKSGLHVITEPEVLKSAKGKGKEKETETAKPKPNGSAPRPGLIQLSVSEAPSSSYAVGRSFGLGVGLGKSTGSMYTHKRASRSLVDLRAKEKKEMVEEIVREEVEREEDERKRKRMSRVEGLSDAQKVKGVKLWIDTNVGPNQKKVKPVEEPAIRGRGSEGTIKLSNVNGDATSSGMTTPKESSNKRLSKAPPYETVVRRRRSLPTFTEAAEPPPYPSFPPLSPSNIHAQYPGSVLIQPREDEGRERLPGYSNDLYLRAVLPRKMEFTSPGVQAKDRKWRRVVCVIEGTALKVYKPLRSEGGKGVLGEWWERKVGVGDATASTLPEPVVKPKKEDLPRRDFVPKLYADSEDGEDLNDFIIREPPTPITPITPERMHPRLTGEHPVIPGQASSSVYGQGATQATRSRLNLSNLLKPKVHSRVNSDASNRNRSNSNSNEIYMGSGSQRSSLNISSVGHGSNASTDPNTPSGHSHSHSLSTALSHNLGMAMSVSQSSLAPIIAVDDPKDLIRSYTMQNAESGLGNDYVKRKHVIRVRAEGEQFLLQTKDVAEVVAWIEILQASANIALDLDERLMPKGPLFPRRRRRRPRATGATTTTRTTTTSTAANAGEIGVSFVAPIAVPL